MKRFLLSLAVLAGLVGSSIPVMADTAQPGAVSLSPPIQKLSLNPGLVQANTTISLANTTSYPMEVHIKFIDFLPFGPDGSIILNTGQGPYAKSGLASWMHLNGSNLLIIAPGQSTDVTVLIDNSATLTPGGHYGAVAFSTELLSGASGPHVNFNQQLYSLYFVNKLGGAVFGLQLASITPDTNSGLPHTVALGFKSTGNVYVVPRGYIEVTDERGKLVANGQINPESSLVPQGSTRSLVTFIRPLATAQGRLKLTVHYRYDGETNFQTESIYLGKQPPSRFILLLLGVAIILAVSYYLVLKQRRKRQR